MGNHASIITGAVLAIGLLPAMAFAQDASADDLMALGNRELRSEVRQRFDAAMSLASDAAVVSADTNRYMWATQARTQCGIALGFLKSGTKDPVSIGKCRDAADRMQGTAAVAAIPAPAPTPVAAPACGQPMAGIVFFDWDSAVPPPSSEQNLAAVASNVRTCGWAGVVVTGHTDRSGSDAYNGSLSIRRANAVASALGALGVPGGQLEVSGRGESEPKVPTADGERNPTNRRVEITVK